MNRGNGYPLTVTEPVSLADLHAVATRVRLPGGLTLDRVQIDGGPAEATSEPPSVTLARPARLEATISEVSLAAYLEAQAPGGLRDFKVRAVEGKLVVEASVRMIVTLSGVAVCRLRIEGGRQVWVDLESVEMAGVGAAALVEAQLKKVNPVFDADSLPIKLTLDRVEAEGGKVTILGWVEGMKPV